MRPCSRVKRSRMRLDSLQSYWWSTKACWTAGARALRAIRGRNGVAPAASLVAVGAQVFFAVGPTRTHLDPELQEDAAVHQVLQLLACLGADALEALAALADDHALVGIALDDDGGR